MLSQAGGFTHAEYTHAAAAIRGGRWIRISIETREEVVWEAFRDVHWEAREQRNRHRDWSGLGPMPW